MLSSIGGWVKDKASDLLATGIQAGGTLAGNAVGGVGSLVENAGRSAGDTVSGSIGGVGGYINNYGDGIKRSMSADGPVSSPAKKTAVKPSTPQAAKKTPAAQKSASSIGATAKSTTNTQPRSAYPSKTVVPSKAPQVRSGGIAPGKGLPPKTKSTVKPANGPQPAPANQKRQVPNTAATGKVTVSPESRPGPRKPATMTASAKKHDAKDPLAIGANFGKVGSIAPSKSGGAKGQSAPPSRKPTAGDPLALGDGINSIGKRK